MMEILVSEFGRSRLIVDDVVGQLSKMRPITTDKAFLDFVEKLEKIHLDLTTMKRVSAVANPTILSDLESKLPTLINIDWHKIVGEENLDEKEDLVIYERFLTFLKEAKSRIKRMTADSRSSFNNNVQKSSTHVNFVTGMMSDKENTSSVKTASLRSWNPCLACNVDGATDLRSTQHPMESCDVWKNLTQKEKEKKVKCIKHPFKDDHTTQSCTVNGRKCKLCFKDTHHFL